MKNRSFVFEINEMFRSQAEVPEWLGRDVPVGGQVRLIREALGMTQAQLAGRCGMRQGMIAKIENDTTLDLRLSTVRKLASGLSCKAVVRLVPEEEIEKTLDRKSLEAALRLVGLSKATSGLEKQMPEDRYIEHQVRDMQQKIREKRSSSVWETHEKQRRK